jgi:septum formation protein
VSATRRPLLILASGSPRRRRLLADAGLQFEVITPDVSESATAALSARELTVLNAARKAAAVARARPDAIVLGADTLVALDGEVLGKPAHIPAAIEMLRRLSGREHQVFTTVHLRVVTPALTKSFSVVSHVRFRPLAENQIRDYFAKVDPLDKAGAYAAQGHGAAIIAEIRGSYTNVVGLPMKETLAALRSFGV